MVNFEIKDYEMLDVLGDITFYNGHSEEIKQLIDYIENNNEIIAFPDFLKKNNCDYFINILWQIMVLIWGDYGTSPRNGWLDVENKKKILEFLGQIYYTATELQ